jgi:hypothetical protein
MDDLYPELKEFVDDPDDPIVWQKTSNGFIWFQRKYKVRTKRVYAHSHYIYCKKYNIFQTGFNLISDIQKEQKQPITSPGRIIFSTRQNKWISDTEIKLSELKRSSRFRWYTATGIIDAQKNFEEKCHCVIVGNKQIRCVRCIPNRFLDRESAYATNTYDQTTATNQRQYIDNRTREQRVFGKYWQNYLILRNTT